MNESFKAGIIMNNRNDIALYKELGRRLLFLLMLFAACVIQFRPSTAQDQIPLPPQKPTSNKNNAGLFDLTQSLLTIKKAQNSDSELPPVPQEKPSKTGVVKKANLAQEAKKKDLELYEEIFDLQEQGKIKQADKIIKELKDDRLYGYVLQQRYLHPTAYTSSFEELRTWLNRYADHPGAHRIYKLAERKRPAGNNSRLPEPQTKIHIIRRSEPTMMIAKQYVSARERTDQEVQAIKSIQKRIVKSIRSGDPITALKLLDAAQKQSLFDTVEEDIVRAQIASGLLYQGKVDEAYKIASLSAESSGLHVPAASWVAGLVSWKREDYSKAARYFESVGRSSYASSWTRAAGSYWAARAHMRRGDVKSVSIWLRRASENPRTFYGLVATRALGKDFDFSWSVPTFTKDNHRILSSDKRGARAIALAKIGQTSNAQAELLRINTKDDPKMHSALLAFAGYARLPGLAMRLGASSAADDENNIYYDAALYPLSPWKPTNGYKLNSTLLQAIMRRESRFNPEAESRSGAIGLMQLMPTTAKSVATDENFDLYDPQTNLELGQAYLQQLLKAPSVDNNLLSLLVAYNAGPGNLAKWRNQWRNVMDPLLFIELLPSSETRKYVERVLSNYWIYRLRDDLTTPTLDAVVAGTPVKYATARSVGIQTASAQ